MRKRSLFALLGAGALIATPTLGVHGPGAHAAPPPPRILTGQTPDVVAGGGAALRGHHDPHDALTLNIGLGVHEGAALDGIIAAAGDPASPSYGHYLTNDQYMARFAPTGAEVQAVRDWASGAGFTVDAVSPDHLLVTVHATVGQVEQALGVTINDYSVPDHAFRANDRDPVVPTGLDIRDVSGLSTLHRFHTALMRPATRVGAFRSGGYYPNDFRAAYNMGPVGDGSGQTIGLTLWGTSVAQSDLNQFAANSGTTRLTGGQAGADGIDWIPVNGGSSDTHELGETAMDVEYAHGVAPGSHLKYWLGDCATQVTANGVVCNPSDTGLELAISDAANDTSLHVVSNSWGGGEATSMTDPFVSNTNASFQHAVSVGTTFYFSSGDSGSNSGGTGQASYPADSPYVVSVGGTSLNTGTGYAYGSESAWSGSGGGCSTVFPRPSWQTGVGRATCSGRAEPDIAADADPNTGADVYYQGGAQQIGGTSLAAPLWSGMAAVTNRYLGANGQALMGFSAPRIYQLANNPTTYARDFHDVTSGSNGYAAGPGWDEATGWGSPNLTNLAADWSGTAPTSTATPVAPTSTAVPPTATPPATTSTAVPATATRPAVTGTPVPVTATSTAVPPTATRPASTNTPVPPTATRPAPTATTPPTTGGASSGTYSGSIGSAGASDSYTFTPGAGGSSTIATCATSTADDYDLYVYNSAGTLLSSGTTSSYCEWVSLNVAAGQTYTVKTVAYKGTGTYRSAWNVNGAQVVWNPPPSGTITSNGGSQTFSFPTLSAGAISLATCGPAGTDFDLYLLNAGNAQLASSTTTSNCESLTYTPSARGLFRLDEVSYNGTGAWSGTIKSY